MLQPGLILQHSAADQTMLTKLISTPVRGVNQRLYCIYYLARRIEIMQLPFYLFLRLLAVEVYRGDASEKK